MSDFFHLYLLVGAIVSFICVVWLWAEISKIYRRIKRLESNQLQHKQEFFEEKLKLRYSHNALVEALGLSEVPAQKTELKYFKKEAKE
jgi:hypothetical protein